METAVDKTAVSQSLKILATCVVEMNDAKHTASISKCTSLIHQS